MEFKIIDNNKEFLSLKEEWEGLQDRVEGVTYYSTFNYVYQWFINIAHNATQNSPELSIVCVYEKNEIIAIAPLMTVKRKFILFSATVLRFVGRADLLNFIIDDNVKGQAVLKKIFEIIDKQLHWDKLELTHIGAQTELAYFCLKSEWYNDSFKLLGENPILSISNFKDFSTYKKAFFKKNINYYRNKIKKDLNATLEVIFGGSELADISKVHIERNSQSKNRRSLFADNKTFTFIKALYDNDKTTVTFLLKAETGEIVSYATCYLFNGILHNWNTSFNLKFKDYSAGDLIYFEMINYAFDHKDKVQMIDFGAGRYAWKFRMTDTFIPVYKLNINNKNSRMTGLLNAYDKLFKIGKIILK